MENKENPLFATTDKSKQLSELISDLSNPKQIFEQPPIKKDPEPGPVIKDIITPAVADPEKWKKAGKIYFTTIDAPLIFGATLLSGKYDPAIKVPKEAKDPLIESWADLCEAYNWEKPPAWLPILSITAGTYGNIFYQAWNIRGERKKTEEATERAERAERELQAIKNKTNGA